MANNHPSHVDNKDIFRWSLSDVIKYQMYAVTGVSGMVGVDTT